jgi:hypothetical protein
VEVGIRSQEVAGCAGRKRPNLAGGQRPSPELVGSLLGHVPLSLRAVDVADLSSGRCKHPCLRCAATSPSLPTYESGLLVSRRIDQIPFLVCDRRPQPGFATANPSSPVHANHGCLRPKVARAVQDRHRPRVEWLRRRKGPTGYAWSDSKQLSRSRPARLSGKKTVFGVRQSA